MRPVVWPERGCNPLHDGAVGLLVRAVGNANSTRRVYVYQRRADGIYCGTLNPFGLQDHFDGGAVSWQVEYDPAENFFRLNYAVGDGIESAVLETRGLERMKFQPYGGGAP